MELVSTSLENNIYADAFVSMAPQPLAINTATLGRFAGCRWCLYTGKCV